MQHFKRCQDKQFYVIPQSKLVIYIKRSEFTCCVLKAGKFKYEKYSSEKYVYFVYDIIYRNSMSIYVFYFNII